MRKTPQEIILNQFISNATIDVLCNIYNIDRYHAVRYALDNDEFRANVADRLAEVIEREVEELIASTDILEHQKLGVKDEQ